MAEKKRRGLLITVEPDRNGLDFGGFLYDIKGARKIVHFSYTDGWMSADYDEMILEVEAMVKKLLKEKKIESEEEPS